MDPYLCVYGHVAMDQILSLERFPEPNTSVDVLEKHRYFGGTGANIATVAAALGVPTALCSFVGKDLPEDFRRHMEEHGVDLGETVTVDNYETSTVLIVTDAQQHQIAYVYQGPMRDMGSFELRTEGARRSKVVHISTGRPEYYLPLMKQCRQWGKEIAFDPAQEIHRIWNKETFQAGAGLCDLFFGNQNELRTALRYLDAQRPEEMLDRIKLIINTQGADGCVIYSSTGSKRVPPAKPLRVIDPTGAGDAFRAGFYAGRYRGYELLDCLAYANAAASFILEARGSVSNLPNWEQVEERAQDILSTLR
jgi:nucleoside kinase